MSHVIGRGRYAHETYPTGSNGGGSSAIAGTQYVFVFRPGDPLGNHQNVYTSWLALYTAASTVAGGVRVFCDDNLGAIHITSGAWIIDGWVFDSAASFVNANGGAIVNVDDGVVFMPNADGNLTFTIGPWTYMVSASAGVAPITLATGECNVVLEEFSAINSLGVKGFFHVTGAAADAFLWLHMTNASIGDSAHPTILFDAGAGGQVNMVSSEIHTLALSGAGIAGLEVFPSYDSNVEYPNAPTFVFGMLNENAGTNGAIPTITKQAGLGGAGAAATISGDATAGIITLTSGAGPAPGVAAHVTFVRTRSDIPHAVLFSPANAVAANAQANITGAPYVTNITVNGFDVAFFVFGGALVAGEWAYLVL